MMTGPKIPEWRLKSTKEQLGLDTDALFEPVEVGTVDGI